MAGDDNYYPGVQVIERPFQPNQQTTTEATAQGAFIGKANQGPTTPYRITSWAKFTSVFGTTYTDLHYAVSDFFNNGGTSAYVQRIVGANAATASANVYANDAPMDPSNPGQVLPGTPPLFSFETLNPGAWGNQLVVVVNARDVTNKRFDVSLFRVPTTVVFDPSKRNSEYQLEQWTDVSLDASDARYLYDMANAPSTSGSLYVRISGQSYNPATPLVQPFPSVNGSTKLTGGVDGSYVDASFNSDAAYQAACDQIREVQGPLVLNIPNVNDADVLRYAVAMAASRGDVFVICDPPMGKTAGETATWADSDLGLGSLGASQPSYGAAYSPWLYLPALGAVTSGKVALRPPGGALTGLYLNNDVTYGVFKSPAGINARITGATDVERKFTEADLTTLNKYNVNAIKISNGNGIVAFGTRTLKKSGKDMYIPVRRTMIYCRESLKRLTEFAVFASNDERLWQDVSTRCRGFLGALWSSGGLKGATAAEAFFVRCDATNNTPTSVDAGQVNIEVGVALQVPAEFIIITIGQYDGGSSVSESF